MSGGLPGDAFAVREMGMDRWLASPAWPVEDDAYFAMVAALRGAYIQGLDELDGVDRHVWMSDYPFVVFLAMHVHALMVEARCAAQGVEVHHGPLSRSFFRPDWDATGRVFARSLGGRSRLALRRLAKNVLCNRQVRPLRALKGLVRPDALGIGSLDPLKTAYAARHGLAVDNTYLPLLYAGCDFFSASPTRALDACARSFAAGLETTLARDHGVELDASAVGACKALRLGMLRAAYDHVVRKGPRVGHVLVTEIARPLHRIAAHALRERGAHAAGFHHGNNMGGLVQDEFAFTGMSAMDEFVCPTPGSTAAFRALYADSPMAERAPVRFTSMDSDKYERLRREAADTPLPERIETVMVMGFPMNAYRALSVPGNHFAPHLELECRIMRQLRESGYRVLYKAHPERLEEARGLFDGICHEVVPEPFEQVWKRADAILIKDTTSTTFGHALCLNRPIVFIDFEKPQWRPEQHELLERRVRRVPARIESGCRFDYEKQDLLAALAAPVGPPPMDYVETFMAARPAREEDREA